MISNQMDGNTGNGLAPNVKESVGLALGGFGGLVLLAVLIALFRGDSDDSAPVVLTIILIFVGVAAYGSMIAGGILAAIALRSGPMESGPGLFAVRMAVILAIVLPIMALTLGLLAVTDTWERDSEPFIGPWLLLALVTSLVGAFSREPGRRGLLVFPFLVGVAAVVLLLSELTGIS